jgi:hypothetical protein
LVVDHQNSVRARRNADIPALPEKDVNIARHFFGFNHYVLLLFFMSVNSFD